MLGIAPLGQVPLGAVPTGAETILGSKWYAPLGEPVRQRIAPALAVALIASGAVVPPIAPFPEAVQEAKWHQAWSEPVVKAKPRLAEAHQQFLAWQPAPSPFAATGWFNWLAEPVRQKPTPFPAAQHYAELDPLPRVSFGWWASLSEPVRLRPALPSPEQHVFAFDPVPFVKIDWFASLAEPVRVRPAVLVPAGEQQFQPFDEDIIFADRWFAWWSQPVRVKPELAAQSQQVLAFAPQPFPFVPGSGGWKKPPRVTPGLDPGAESDRRVKRPGDPRRVAPKVEPPTFADVIASQTPAQLVDVLGSQYLPLLGSVPPAPDLYVPPIARQVPPQLIATHTLSEIEEQTDVQAALDALDALDEQDRADVLALLMGKETT
jgi:hypothetical protein